MCTNLQKRENYTRPQLGGNVPIRSLSGTVPHATYDKRQDNMLVLLSCESLHVLTNLDIEQLLPSSPYMYMLQSETLEHLVPFYHPMHAYDNADKS